MKTILIAKGGSAYRTRAEAERSSAVGEQGETEGVIHHLLECTDINLVYFGKYHGEVPDGLTVIEPDLSAFRGSMLPLDSEQQHGFANDIKALKHLEPQAFIHTAGYAPTFSMINNPNFATVQQAAINYTAPMHNVLNHFKIPRFVINNDPRTYPRDQEMSKGWPYSRPRALLDQKEDSWSKVVGGVKYACRSVHARAESWCHHPQRENTGQVSTVVISHCHIGDGIRTRGREASWHNVLDGYEPMPSVYGKGWEWYDGPINYKGILKPSEVYDEFRDACTTPVIAAVPGFYTGKPYVAISQGCIPLLYGDGVDPCTWDPKEMFSDLTSEYRIVKPGDYQRIVKQLRADTDLRAQMQRHWKNMCNPDWSLLDCLVEDFLNGMGIDTETWWDWYGGYQQTS